MTILAGPCCTLFSLCRTSSCYSILCGFIHLFQLDPGSPRWWQKHNKNTSKLTMGTAECRAFLVRSRRPRRVSNRGKTFCGPVQSDRGEHIVGGSRAAPERDIEIVGERRLVGHECHSLRVLIIWRGVCSARPVRLSRWKSRRSWDRT